jgi:predicted nucleotidyltransferase
MEFKRYLEKTFGKKVDIGIESSLKPEARKTIEKEIFYV